MDKVQSITRRALLKAAPGTAAGVATALTVAPAIAALPAVTEADPIVAAIKATKVAARDFYRQHDALDEREAVATRARGRRPWSMIAWRNYGAIGGNEIERCRDEFLARPGADRQLVEIEYQDAKRRECEAEKAGIEWDRQAGLYALRRRIHALRRNVSRSEWRLARTIPTTLSGAVALLTLVNKEMGDGLEADWHLTALKTVAKAMRQGAA